MFQNVIYSCDGMYSIIILTYVSLEIILCWFAAQKNVLLSLLKHLNRIYLT